MQYFLLLHYRMHSLDLLRLLGKEIAMLPRFKVFEEKEMKTGDKRKRQSAKEYVSGGFTEDENLELKATGF